MGGLLRDGYHSEISNFLNAGLSLDQCVGGPGAGHDRINDEKFDEVEDRTNY